MVSYLHRELELGVYLLRNSVEKNINTHAFRFVPYYAHPAAFGSQSILLCNSPVHRGDLLDMKRLEGIVTSPKEDPSTRI
jgi:hypothetical protein